MESSRFVPGMGPAAGGDSATVWRDGLLIAVYESSVVVRTGAPDEPPSLPTAAELRPYMDEDPLPIGTLNGRRVWAACLRLPSAQRAPDPLPAPLALVPARRILFAFDAGHVAAVGQAMAIVDWDLTARFCGRCAALTERNPVERVRVCGACGTSYRPRVPPAIIVAVERPGQILLARGRGFPPGLYGLVAGFVEPGETLEEAAVREVREEVGLEIADLVYAGSQPWPIGRSLMVAFRAQYAGGTLRVDANELEEAAFFSADQVPTLPPLASIARRLIEAWVARQRGAAPSPQ